MTPLPWTFWVDLDTLDAQRASYKHVHEQESLTGMWLDRDVWERLGRPSRLEVSPKPA